MTLSSSVERTKVSGEPAAFASGQKNTSSVNKLFCVFPIGPLVAIMSSLPVTDHLKMKAAYSSEMLESIYKSIRPFFQKQVIFSQPSGLQILIILYLINFCRVQKIV
jgi:hypothetical protein